MDPWQIRKSGPWRRFAPDSAQASARGLYDLGKSAKAATRVTGYELFDVRRQVLYQVKKSFADALAAREALGLAQQNLEVLDEVDASGRGRYAQDARSQALKRRRVRNRIIPPRISPWEEKPS